MAISDGLGIQALVQSYDKKAVSQAFAEIAKDFNKSADELNNEINKIKIDKDVMNNLVNQIRALPEEVRKKTQGMSFDLFSDLINADGAEEKIDEAFKLFSNKIQSFVKLRDQIGNDEIIIKADYSQIDELIQKTERLLKLQDELNKWKSGKSRTKKSINTDISNVESEIKTGISNLNIDITQVGVGVNVDNEALVELDKRIKETEESLKSAREEAEKYGTSLDTLKKKVERAYNKSVEDDSDKATKNYLKAVQEYRKAGGSEKVLSKDELDWYKLAGVSYPKQFIPLDQITNESEMAQKKIQELENALSDLYKQRDALTKGAGSETKYGTNTGFDNSNVIEGQNKLQSELDETKGKLQEVGIEAQETKQKVEDLGKTDVNHEVNQKKSLNPSPTPEKDTPKTDSSSILSEQQALEKLEQAIKSVTVAIAEKNKAIQAEEVQMDLSINQEIKKLEELKGKLNEIKTEFENGIASGLFKSKTNTDGGNNGSDGNTQSIELVPLIDDNQWMNAVDDIITKIGTKKINIEPDMTSEEWNTLKNYIDNISKQVINMKFINGDSALPSDLSTSYTNSTKYVTELYKIEEKIARAKENNNKRELENLTTLEAEKKKFEDLLKLEEQFRANDRFKDFDTTVKDNNLNKLISTKEQEYQANRVAAETSLTNKLPSIEEEAYKVNESFNNTKSLEKVNSLLDEQKKKWQEIQDIRIQMETLDLNDSANKDQNKIEYENLDAQKKYLEEEKKLIDDELKQYDSLIDKATELKQIRELDKITSDADSQINGDRISNISNAYNEAVRINNALNNTETTLENLKNTIRDVRNQTSNEIFGNALKNAEQDAEELKTQLISGQISLSQYNSAIRNIQKDVSAQKDAVGFIDVDDIDQAREALTNYAREVTNGTIENVQWNTSTSTLTGSFVNENKEVQKVTASIKQLSTGSQVATVSFGKAEKQVTSFSKFIDELGAKFRNLSTYLLSFVGFYEVWGAIQQGVTYVRELDTALTEMRKVSDETVESLREFQEASFGVADSIGTTAKEIQNSTADFMRLGYSLQEAGELAQDANIYANVGDMEIDEATEHMISSIKAWGSEFESEVEASEAIIDRYNEIGNNFAISSADIGEAMERSGAALKAAGNSLNESLGLIVSGNLIQQEATTTAAALRTMSLRIRGASSELEEMGESTEGMVTSTAKLREEIKDLTGVDIMLDDETFKSTAEIIKELGAVWENLNDVTQANVLEQLAGEFLPEICGNTFYRTHLIARIA